MSRKFGEMLQTYLFYDGPSQSEWSCIKSRFWRMFKSRAYRGRRQELILRKSKRKSIKEFKHFIPSNSKFFNIIKRDYKQWNGGVILPINLEVNNE